MCSEPRTVRTELAICSLILGCWEKKVLLEPPSPCIALRRAPALKALVLHPFQVMKRSSLWEIMLLPRAGSPTSTISSRSESEVIRLRSSSSGRLERCFLAYSASSPPALGAHLTHAHRQRLRKTCLSSASGLLGERCGEGGKGEPEVQRATGTASALFLLNSMLLLLLLWESVE